jgi:hypothetical protein
MVGGTTGLLPEPAGDPSSRGRPASPGYFFFVFRFAVFFAVFFFPPFFFIAIGPSSGKTARTIQTPIQSVNA